MACPRFLRKTTPSHSVHGTITAGHGRLFVFAKFLTEVRLPSVHRNETRGKCVYAGRSEYDTIIPSGNRESQPAIKPRVDVIRRIKCVDREHSRKISWRAEKGESLRDEGVGRASIPARIIARMRGSVDGIPSRILRLIPQLDSALCRISDQNG